MPRTATPLVGRVSELTTLVDAVRGVTDGPAAAVVVSGDAGVGKTRLLGELIAVAHADGVLCLVGHCVDLGDTPPPYLPFTEAFTRLAAERPEVVDELLVAFPALARLVPGRSGAAPRTPEDRVDRGELFDSVLGALVWLAASAPVALLVEDAHWADQATRDLLGFLFTRLQREQLTVVVSYRSDDLHRRHPLRRTLAEWSRLATVTRVHLDPLESTEVRALVRAMNPEPMADTDVDGIVTRADGNAFFAEELLAATLQCTDTRQLPWQLAELLLVRLDRLSPAARQVVRVAAVAGRRVPHEMLEAVVEMPAAELEDALREAIDTQVLQLTTSGRGYTFRHALLAEAVYDDLLPGERVRLHAAYAAVLAAVADRRPAELARHALASHDLATALGASVAAGDEAMSLAAPQEAMQHYETALELLPRVPEAPLTAPQLTLAVVEAADAAGHAIRGARLATRALGELPADAPPLDRATLLFASARAALAGGEFGEEALVQTAEALQLVPESPPTAFRAELLAAHARVAYNIGREVDAVRTAREAIEVADAVGSRSIATDARASLAILERRTGEPAEAARQLAAVAEQARATGEVAVELRSRYSLASLWHEQSELVRAEDEFVRIYRRASEVGRRWEVWSVQSRAMAATMQYLRGEWDAALRTLDTAGERPTPVASAVFRTTALVVQAGRGDLTGLDVVEQTRPYWSREGRIPLYAGFGAMEIYEQQADVPAALALLDELVDVLGSLWLDPWFLARIQLCAQGLAVLCAAATTAPESQHAALAAHGIRLLEDGRTSARKGLPRGRLMGREGAAWLIRLEAESARLRWLTGIDAPAAEELVSWWQQAVDEFDFGHEVQLTRSRVRLAAALRATGHAAESNAAAALARAGAQAMGAQPVLAELRSLGAGGPRRQAETGLPALTDRERDVVAQLVEGRTNRQIAATLFISEKTVSVHVSNILAKLGVRSRAEAAALARRAD